MLCIYDESSRIPNVHEQAATLTDWYVIGFMHGLQRMHRN